MCVICSYIHGSGLKRMATIITHALKTLPLADAIPVFHKVCNDIVTS